MQRKRPRCSERARKRRSRHLPFSGLLKPITLLLTALHSCTAIVCDQITQIWLSHNGDPCSVDDVPSFTYVETKKLVLDIQSSNVSFQSQGNKATLKIRDNSGTTANINSCQSSLTFSSVINYPSGAFNGKLDVKIDNTNKSLSIRPDNNFCNDNVGCPLTIFFSVAVSHSTQGALDPIDFAFTVNNSASEVGQSCSTTEVPLCSCGASFSQPNTVHDIYSYQKAGTVERVNKIENFDLCCRSIALTGTDSAGKTYEFIDQSEGQVQPEFSISTRGVVTYTHSSQLTKTDEVTYSVEFKRSDGTVLETYSVNVKSPCEYYWNFDMTLLDYHNNDDRIISETAFDAENWFLYKSDSFSYYFNDKYSAKKFDSSVTYSDLQSGPCDQIKFTESPTDNTDFNVETTGSNAGQLIKVTWPDQDTIETVTFDVSNQRNDIPKYYTFEASFLAMAVSDDCKPDADTQPWTDPIQSQTTLTVNADGTFSNLVIYEEFDYPSCWAQYTQTIEYLDPDLNALYVQQTSVRDQNDSPGPYGRTINFQVDNSIPAGNYRLKLTLLYTEPGTSVTNPAKESLIDFTVDRDCPRDQPTVIELETNITSLSQVTLNYETLCYLDDMTATSTVTTLSIDGTSVAEEKFDEYFAFAEIDPYMTIGSSVELQITKIPTGIADPLKVFDIELTTAYYDSNGVKQDVTIKIRLINDPCYTHLESMNDNYTFTDVYTFGEPYTGNMGNLMNGCAYKMVILDDLFAVDQNDDQFALLDPAPAEGSTSINMTLDPANEPHVLEFEAEELLGTKGDDTTYSIFVELSAYDLTKQVEYIITVPAKCSQRKVTHTCSEQTPCQVEVEGNQKTFNPTVDCNIVFAPTDCSAEGTAADQYYDVLTVPNLSFNYILYYVTPQDIADQFGSANDNKVDYEDEMVLEVNLNSSSSLTDVYEFSAKLYYGSLKPAADILVCEIVCKCTSFSAVSFDETAITEDTVSNINYVDYMILQPTLEIPFAEPECELPSGCNASTGWTYTLTFDPTELAGFTIELDETEGKVKIGTDPDVSLTENKVVTVTLQASRSGETTQQISFEARIFCSCTEFEFPAEGSSTLTHTFGQLPTIVDMTPVCKIASQEQCRGPSNWVYTRSQPAQQASESIVFSDTVEGLLTLDQSENPDPPVSHTILLTATPDDPVFQVVQDSFTFEFKKCECMEYKVDFEDIVINNSDPGPHEYQVDTFECLQQYLLTIDDCIIDDREWSIEEATLDSQATLPPSIEFDPVQNLFTIEFDESIEEVQTYRVHFEAKPQDNPAVSILHTFTVTHEPCFCEQYDWPNLQSVTINKDEGSKIVFFEPPTCAVALGKCVMAQDWSYSVKPTNGSPLPSHISLNSETMLIAVSGQFSESQTLELELEAVSSNPLIDASAQCTVTIELIAESFTISVEPSLADTYEMLFTDYFAQNFQFSIEPDDEVALEIGKLRPEDSFLKAAANEDGIVEIQVDGQMALTSATKEELQSFKLFTLDFKVNDQTFSFKIKIKLQEPLAVDVDDESIPVGQYVPGDFFTNPLYRLYNFIPKRPPRAVDEPIPIEIKAKFEYIEVNGEVSIIFQPPVATVHKVWKDLFHEEERQKFGSIERQEFEKFANYALNVTFVKKSHEKDQAYVNCTLTEFTEAGIKFKLTFSDPLLVSQGQQADQIKLSLLKSYFLEPVPEEKYPKRVLNMLKRSTYDEFEYLTHHLPPMMASEDEFNQMQGSTKSASSAITGQFIVTAILQLFLSGALSMLWNIFNTLQIITALNLLMVILPANIKMVNDEFTSLIQFEIIPKDIIFDSVLAPVFDLQSSEEKRKFKEAKERQMDFPTKAEDNISQGMNEEFDGTNILMNIASVLLIIFCLIFLIALVICCKRCVMPSCPTWFRSVITTLERRLFWNSVMRACLESYLSLSIMALHEFPLFDTYSYEGTFNMFTAVVVGLFCLVFPFYCWFFLFNRFFELREPEMRQRYGALYQNVETFKGPIALTFLLLFCLRRLFFAYAVCIIDDTVTYQIFFIDFLSTFLLGYFIMVKPMIDGLNNFIHIFNEIVVLLATQTMLLFTQFVGDPIVRYQYGYYFIYMIAFNIIVNFGVLVVSICRAIYKAARIAFYKRRQRKIFAEKAKLRPFYPSILKIKRKDEQPKRKMVTFADDYADSSESESSSSEDEAMLADGLTKELIYKFVNIDFKSAYFNFTEKAEDLDYVSSIFTMQQIDDFKICSSFESMGYYFDVERGKAYKLDSVNPLKEQLQSMQIEEEEKIPNQQESQLISQQNDSSKMIFIEEMREPDLIMELEEAVYGANDKKIPTPVLPKLDQDELRDQQVRLRRDRITESFKHMTEAEEEKKQEVQGSSYDLAVAASHKRRKMRHYVNMMQHAQEQDPYENYTLQ